MSEPFLYLEDLVKAAVPKPPKNIGGGDKPAGARMTLAGGPKATPKPSSKAQAIAGPGPAANIGGGTAPPAAQTLNQGSSTPKPSEGAKALGGPKQKLEYWSGGGTPPTDGGWTQTASGAWARPEGSGKKGGAGEAESLISDMAATGEDPATVQAMAQDPDQKRVSSGDEPGPVSSSAAKIEEAKQGGVPPVSEGARKVSDQKKQKGKMKAAQEAGGVPALSEGADASLRFKREEAKDAKESKATAKTSLKEADEHIKNGNWAKAEASLAEAYKNNDTMTTAQRGEMLAKQDAVEAGKAQKPAEGEEPKAPSTKKPEVVPVTSFEGEMERDLHKKNARKLSESIRSNIEAGMVPEDEVATLEKIADELDMHQGIENMPSESEKKILSTGRALAGEYSKPPKPEEAGQDKRPPARPMNYAGAFNRGKGAGSSAGAAAATAEGAGGLAQAIDYGSSGAVNAGHHLLSRDGRSTAATTPTATKKAPAKGAEVEQSAMKTQKSLELYIDLDIIKAVQSPNIGTTTPTESRARIQHESSYAKRPVGVANEGIVTEDDPDQGKKWPHSDEDSVEADVDAKLKEKEEDEEETEDTTVEKSYFVAPDPLAFLKSLNSEVREELKRVLPTDMEASFMVEVLGHDPALVSKGQTSITGKDRHRFNEWMHGRLSNSISSLNERVLIK